MALTKKKILPKKVRPSIDVPSEQIETLSKEASDQTLSKKMGKAACLTSIDPYSKTPRNDRAVQDLSTVPNMENVKFVKYRFDDNYIFCTERIEPSRPEYGITSYPAWSIKRVRCGENDADKVPDKQGVLNDRFAFSGKLASITELHEALVLLAEDSETETMISWDEAKALEEGPFGIFDISTACRPVYSEKIFGFGQHRVYFDDVTYNNASKHDITYKAISLTKWRDEKSRSRSKNPDSKFFIVHLPARRHEHLILCVEMCMLKCGIKSKIPFRHVGKMKKKKRCNRPHSPSESDESEFNISDIDDDDDEDEDEPTPTVEEEEATAEDGEPTASDLEFIDDGPATPKKRVRPSQPGQKTKKDVVEIEEDDGDDEDDDDDFEAPATKRKRKRVASGEALERPKSAKKIKLSKKLVARKTK